MTRAMRAKIRDEEGPHPLDIALGGRVRAYRKALGFSQDQLAKSVGITFQQVQKYEHGTNRISFSRLVEIATSLKTSVTEMIKGLDNNKTSASSLEFEKMLMQTGAPEMLKLFTSIKSRKTRTALMKLAQQVVSDSED